jgi:hypothetical protein
VKIIRVFFFVATPWLSSCGLYDSQKDFDESKIIILNISKEGPLKKYLSENNLATESGILDYSLVFGGITEPTAFKSSDRCHVESTYCLEFIYKLKSNSEKVLLAVGFDREGAVLKISSRSIYMNGTF